MIFKSELKRTYWAGIGLRFATDFILVAALVLIFARSNHLFLIILIFVGVYMFEALIALYRFTQNILISLNFGRDDRIETSVDDFMTHSYPSPDEYHEDICDYLARVAADDDQPIDTRLEASRNLGAFQQLNTTGPQSAKIISHLDAEKALKRFARYRNRSDND